MIPNFRIVAAVCLALGLVGPFSARAYTLRLTTDRGCYRVGETVVVLVTMQNVAPTPAAGFQALIDYDAAHLQFVGWSYTSAPFGLPVLNTPAVVNPAAGQVDLASGINLFLGQAPTTINAVVAVVTFTALGPLDYTTIPVWFRTTGVDPPNPPTRLTSLGGAPLLPLSKFDAALVSISSTMRGDGNCDGVVNNFDIDFFVSGILFINNVVAPPIYITQGGTQSCWDGRLCWGDLNSDLLFNNFDIDPFVACILTPPPPATPCP